MRNRGRFALVLFFTTLLLSEVLRAQQSTFAFGHNTIVDFSATSGEPHIRVAPNDEIFISSPFGVSTTVSLMWKSIDGGKTFIPLGTPIVRDSVAAPGGGDTHIDFDDQGRVYFNDLSAACITTAVSNDGGNTFPPTQTNSLVCLGGGQTPTGATDDRQWIAATGDGIGYASVRNLEGSGFYLFKTTDAGITWDGRQIGSVGQSGPMVLDKTKRLVGSQMATLIYQVYDGGLFRVTDFNDGSALVVDTFSGPDSGWASDDFEVLEVDTAGNLYTVWSGGGIISLSHSTDRGDNWSNPVQVNVPSGGTNIMPWIAVGDPGRVEIIWYHSPLAGNPNLPTSRWDLLAAQSLDALSANPTFVYTTISEAAIHLGEICQAGLNCDTSVPMRDRSFLEFPSIHKDSRGAGVVTYNDSTNPALGARIMFARQRTGPSLFSAVGVVENPGTVTIASPTSGQVLPSPSFTASGTHTLPPGTFTTDLSGDARFPDHGPSIGANVPGLDIQQVKVSDDGTALTVNVQLADTTTAALAAAPALSGGDGLLYVTEWKHNDTIYWVAAEVRGTTPVFRTGTFGIVKSATSKKYMTYNPDPTMSLQVSGAITAGTPGTLTMTIPKSLIGNPPAGAAIPELTTYAMSERGPLLPVPTNQAPDPTSFPIKVDAAPAFTYVLGQGAKLDGGVEVSLDDPSFASPVAATLSGLTANWSAALGPSGIFGGTHTLYARQRIGVGAPSPSASVSFSVVGPPPAGLTFYTLTPCRIIDTRQQGGALATGIARTMAISGICGVPATAKAVSLNLTVASPSGSGNVAVFPDAGVAPVPGTLFFAAGQNRANNQVLALAALGDGTLQALATVAGSGTVHLVIDVNGYFQ